MRGRFPARQVSQNVPVYMNAGMTMCQTTGQIDIEQELRKIPARYHFFEMLRPVPSGRMQSLVRIGDAAHESLRRAVLSISDSLLRHPSFIRAAGVDALVRICAGGRSAMIVPTATRWFAERCSTSGVIVIQAAIDGIRISRARSLFSRSFLFQECRAHIGTMDICVAIGAELDACCQVMPLYEGVPRRRDLWWKMAQQADRVDPGPIQHV